MATEWTTWAFVEGSDPLQYTSDVSGTSGDTLIQATMTQVDGNSFTLTSITNSYNSPDFDLNTFDLQEASGIEGGASIVGIAADACTGRTQLLSFTTAGYNVSIGNYAFLNCSNLSTVNTRGDIGSGAFQYCGELTTCTIFDQTSSIGDNAFDGCTNLQTVIPARVTSIGTGAFDGCTGATVVFLCPLSAVAEFGDIPAANIYYDPAAAGWSTGVYKSLATVAPDALYSLQNQYLSAGGVATYYPAFGVTWSSWQTVDGGITYSSFYGQSDIVARMTQIGDAPSTAFTLTLVEEYSFSHIYHPIAFEEGRNVDLRGRGYGPITTPVSISLHDIGLGAPAGYTITEIGVSAFLDSAGLTYVELSNSVTSIGAGAFSGCSSLATLTMTNAVTSIGAGAFAGCTILQTAIPRSVTSIGLDAFVGCTGATVVFLCPSTAAEGGFGDIPAANIYYDPAAAGWSTLGYTSLGDVNDNVLAGIASQYQFASGSVEYYPVFGLLWSEWVAADGVYTSSLVTANAFPSTTVTTIATMTPVVGSTTAFTLASVFQVLGTDASGTPIYLPVAIDIAAINAVSGISGSAITGIGEFAFDGSIALVGVAIPSTVTSIGASAFFGCVQFQTVIPDSVTSIGAGAFDGCTGATVVFLCPFIVTGGDLGDIPATNVYYDPAATSPLMVRGKYGFIITARTVYTDWPAGSWSLSDPNLPADVLYFLAFYYLVADGPSIYYSIFGIVPPCYVKGTEILTMQGYKAIENITENDKVIIKGVINDVAETLYSDVKHDRIVPVVWKGHFTINEPSEEYLPVCIKKDAFGAMRPSKDLYVSPGHRVLVNGKMEMAAHLLNGTTIVRDDACKNVTYYHLEVKQHSALIANGIAAESFKNVKDGRRIFTKSH